MAKKGLVGALSAMCPRGSLLQLLCVNVYFTSFAAHLPPLTKRMARNIAENSPNGVSVKQLVHFGQLIESGRFHQFDYKEPANRRIYGQAVPPEYQLRARINVSLQVFYGTADTVTSPLGVQRLIDECEPFVERVLPSIGANHFDFVLNSDARDKYYEKIVRFVRRADVASSGSGD